MELYSRFNQTKIKVQIIVSFIIIAILIWIFGVRLHLVMTKISDYIHTSENQQAQLSRAQDIVWLDEVLTQSMRNYAFTKDSLWFNRYDLNGAKLDSVINICKLSSENKVIKQIFEKQDVVNAKLVEMEMAAANVIKNGESEKALQMLNSEEYINNKEVYIQTVNDFYRHSETGFANAQNDLNQSIKNSYYFLVASFFIGILIIFIGVVLSALILKPLYEITQLSDKIAKGDLTVCIKKRYKNEIGLLITAFEKMIFELRKVVTNIRNNAGTLASASIHIANSSQQIATGASEQASASEELSASIEQLTSSINQNTEIAQEAENISNVATKGVIEGKNASNKTVIAMKKIAENITAVQEISSKTDLLAINAAIEAARAGEYGFGFAIVAQEIRNLAMNSEKLATEIEALTSESLLVAKNSGSILEQITPEVERTSTLVREIAATSLEQNMGIEQINKAIYQLTSVTQENTASAEQLSSSSEELANQAEVLKDTVSFFILDQTDDDTNISDIKDQMNNLSKMLKKLENKAQNKSTPIPQDLKQADNKGVNIDLGDANFENF